MNPTEAASHAETLYRDHHGLVRDYVHRMCRNAHLSDDLAAETFERALRALNRPDATAHENPTAWLRTIARNLLIDHYRTAAYRRETSLSADAIDGVFDSTDDRMRTRDPFGSEQPADAALMEKEALREAGDLLDCLTTGQRQAIVLGAIDGYTPTEVADLMGRSPQAVRSLRHKAGRRLARAHREFVEDLAG